MIVLGALVAFTILVYILANSIHDRTQGRYIDENPLKADAVAQRLAPAAVEAVAGQPDPGAAVMPAPVRAVPAAPAATEPAPAAAPPDPQPAAAVAAADSGADGEKIYNSACMACHMLGVAGAPKFGDADAWTPRIARGIDTLYSNSINGYQGEAGVMPPKGGRLDLSDDEVKAAVDHMVGAVQ
ncbi:MAG: c-type cytochrome [Gammaproteobacteria bacterium]|nr:c-type cytochrome [Gammaproteobacteria bacterium]NNF61750.1 cytochrome c5 family protein [Gammaproteobacteria bacterium]NNM21518.1 cytochrome c5 family protein [Gammaproteobacteria bacterium]